MEFILYICQKKPTGIKNKKALKNCEIDENNIMFTTANENTNHTITPENDKYYQNKEIILTSTNIRATLFSSSSTNLMPTRENMVPELTLSRINSHESNIPSSSQLILTTTNMQERKDIILSPRRKIPRINTALSAASEEET
jgi:hypothetical protein